MEVFVNPRGVGTIPREFIDERFKIDPNLLLILERKQQVLFTIPVKRKSGFNATFSFTHKPNGGSSIDLEFSVFVVFRSTDDKGASRLVIE